MISTERGEVYRHRSMPLGRGEERVVHALSAKRAKARIIATWIALRLVAATAIAAIANVFFPVIAEEIFIAPFFAGIVTLGMVGQSYKRTEQTLNELFAGKYRLHYVVPTDYSFRVVFSPALRSAIKNPGLAHSVDRLFNSIDSITPDQQVTGTSLQPSDIQMRYSSRIRFIEQVEQLYANYGIRAKRHFTKLRQEANMALDADLEEANRQHEADGKILRSLQRA